MSIPTYLILGFCIGLLPGLIYSIVIIRKLSSETSALRERLAAEEASKRHFLDLATRQEATIALMYQEQKRRLEVEIACVGR
jgi:hypothetical protein